MLTQIADYENQVPTDILQPSQTRYLSYFEEVLNGFIPLNKPLILQRIIMSGIPDVEGGESSNSSTPREGSSDDDDLRGGASRRR